MKTLTQTIQTRVQQAAPGRRRRVEAYTPAGHKTTVLYDKSLNPFQNHMLAARAVAVLAGWPPDQLVAAVIAPGQNWLFIVLPL